MIPIPPPCTARFLREAKALCPAFTTTECAVLHPFFPFLLWIYHALLFGLTAYISKPFFQTKRANVMAEASLSVVSHSIRIAAISSDDPFRTPRVSQRPSIEIPPFQRRPREAATSRREGSESGQACQCPPRQLVQTASQGSLPISHSPGALVPRPPLPPEPEGLQRSGPGLRQVVRSDEVGPKGPGHQSAAGTTARPHPQRAGSHGPFYPPT